MLTVIIYLAHISRDYVAAAGHGGVISLCIGSEGMFKVTVIGLTFNRVKVFKSPYCRKTRRPSFFIYRDPAFVPSKHNGRVSILDRLYFYLLILES